MTPTFRDLIAEIESDPARAEQEAEWKPSRDVALMLVGVRLELGISQAEFAHRAGVSQSYISQLESGVANPSMRTLARVLRKNGVELKLVPAFPEACEISQDTERGRQKAS